MTIKFRAFFSIDFVAFLLIINILSFLFLTESKNQAQSHLSQIIHHQSNLQLKQAQINNMLNECVLTPINSKHLEEWKKNNTNLEREHIKEFKKLSSEIKKMQSDTVKLQKKALKKETGCQNDNSSRAALQVALQEVSQRVARLEQSSRNAMDACYREQAGRFLTLITAFTPMLEMQISGISELTSMQKITNELAIYKEQLTGIVNGSYRIDPEPNNMSNLSPNGQKLDQLTSSTNSLNVGNAGNQKVTLRNRNHSLSTSQSSESNLSNEKRNLMKEPMVPSSLNSNRHSVCSAYGLTTNNANIRHPSLGVPTSTYNIDTLGSDNSGTSNHQIQSVSSRDSGFLSYEMALMQSQNSKELISNNQATQSNNNLRMQNFSSSQSVASGHSMPPNVTLSQSNNPGSQHKIRQISISSNATSNTGLPLPPPPTDWMEDSEGLPVPPPPKNTFPSRQSSIKSNPGILTKNKPPLTPKKPSVTFRNNSTSLSSQTSINSNNNNQINKGQLKMEPVSPGPGIPVVPSRHGRLITSSYTNVNNQLINNMQNNLNIQNSLPPTPNKNNALLKLKMRNNSSISSNSAVVVESGTATIRRRASTRMTGY